MPILTTYNGVNIPAFMYGTAWKKDATAQLVQLAVTSGFTAIDTANQLIHYQEALVGEALLALGEQGIPRNSLFLQTKFTSVNGQDHRTPYDPISPVASQVKQSFESSLEHLHTDYLDSFVLHGPYSRYGLGKEDWEVWTAMEDLYNSGRTKMIGISNVTAPQLTELCDKATIKPMIVQNRCYAAMAWDKEVREICQTHGIIYEGFSLLTANPEVWRSPEVLDIAKQNGTGSMQIIFRYAQQVGMLPLTGTSNKQHMKEDLDIQHFSLTPDQISMIELLAV
ncbi:MAG: aldo/keto reductase [Nitrospirota bacterium]|nr:aldo/keto reductase [Nitrospirota bacterium]